MVVAADEGVFVRRAARVVVLRDGRAVAERIRQLAFARGKGEILHELAAVDGQGRVSMPPGALESLGIAGRAIVTQAGDHIEVRPDRPPAAAPERAWRRQL